MSQISVKINNLSLHGPHIVINNYFGKLIGFPPKFINFFIKSNVSDATTSRKKTCHFSELLF